MTSIQDAYCFVTHCYDGQVLLYHQRFWERSERLIFLATIVIKCKYLIREHFRRNFSGRKEKETVNVEIEIEKPESSPMISVSKLNSV